MDIWLIALDCKPRARYVSLIKEALCMKRILLYSAILMLIALVPAIAQNEAELKTAYENAVKLAAPAPQDYTLNWQAAQAARKYGDYLVAHEVPGWKDTARAAAKEGMKYGEIAFKLNPTGIEGWYYYGLCVGTYSDCVSVVKALTEGLKGKTQMGFENAYKFDKTYDNGGPILSLGRFWQVLPGIAGQDRKKAEQLFDEYINLFGSSPDVNSDVWYFRGQLYKDTNRLAQARADLEKAASMGNNNAQKLLAEFK
jgi:tetratricopeptide (TPR) repeat protein